MGKSGKHGRSEAQPILGQRGKEMQPFGELARYPLGLSDKARAASVEALNKLLCDAMCPRPLASAHARACVSS